MFNQMEPYIYNFPIIKNEDDFLNIINDIATFLFTLYSDIPSSYYFFKDKDYQVRFSNDKNVITTLHEKCPYLYQSFIYSLNGKNINDLTQALFINNKLSFTRKIIDKNIYSKSNSYNLYSMRFKDVNLYYSIFKLELDVKSNTVFSKINQKINLVKGIIKKNPEESDKNKVISIIKSLNGRQGEYYFENKYHFSWASLIISHGNTLWLNELNEYISKNTYDMFFNSLVLSIFLDDINILKFYFNTFTEQDLIIKEPFLEIKKFNINYVNYRLYNEKNISLLSLAIILNAYNCFKILIDKIDIDQRSGLNEQSSIFYACSECKIDFIQLLVKKRCNLNLEDKNNHIASELLPNNPQADNIFIFLEDKRKAS